MLTHRVFKHGVFAVALAFAMLTAGAAAHAQETVQISIGQQKTIKVSGLQRVAIADPKVAEVSVLGKGDQVLIVGKSVGSTDLTLWTKAGEVHYTVDVAAKDPKQLLSELKQLLAGIEGITFRTVGAKVVIDGRILTLEDQERITKVVSLYGDQVVTFAKADKEMRNVVADQINKSLEASGIAGIKARSVGKSLLLEGAAPTPEAAKRAHQIALSIAPDVQNLVKIGAGKDMIVMDVNFVEIRSSDIKNFGIKWQDALSAAGTVTLKKDISGGGMGGEHRNRLGPRQRDQDTAGERDRAHPVQSQAGGAERGVGRVPGRRGDPHPSDHRPEQHGPVQEVRDHPEHQAGPGGRERGFGDHRGG